MAVGITDRLFGENSSVAIKAPVLAVATTPITLSGLQAIGSYTTQSGDRVLVIAQDDATTNGIYNASTAAWTRTGDFDGTNDVVQGTVVMIASTNPPIYYFVTTQGPVIGSTEINFSALNIVGTPNYIQTPAELALGVIPVSYFYPQGHAYRYGTNTTPGTTDMTAPLNTAADVCRQAGCPLYLPPETMLVSASLDFSGIAVVGMGNPWADAAALIKANASQFDVVTTTGASLFYNFGVDGGNPDATAALTGHNFSVKATSPAFPYLVSFMHVSSAYAKEDLCYIEAGGYTDFYHFHGLTAGKHGLELFGDSSARGCTTIRDHGGSQFGSCPNGYGITLTECFSCAFHDTIIEDTWGIELNGEDNRALVFDGVYQEVTATSSFTGKIDNGSGSAGTTLTVSAWGSGPPLQLGTPLPGAADDTVITALGTGAGGVGTYTVSVSQLVASTAMTGGAMFVVDNGAGIGLTFRGCFGGNATMPPLSAWENVYYQGNSNLAQGPIPYANRIQSNSAGQQVVSATSDVTIGSIALAQGTYRVSGGVQTIISSGGGSLTQLACAITSDGSSTGPWNSTSSFFEAADQTGSFGGSQDGRVRCYGVIQLTAPTTYYLRAHLTISGTLSLGVNGLLRAELIE